MRKLKHKFLNVTGDIDLDAVEIICVPQKKHASVDLCFKANMHIPFAKIILYSKDRYVDAIACFESAKSLGEEIAKRWDACEEPKRCPHCYLAIAPDEVRRIWMEKFGSREKPHYKTKCKLCGKPAGEHYGTDCEKGELNMNILEKAKSEVCIHYPGCPCCRRFIDLIDKANVELERPVGNKSTELNKAKEVLSWCQENADEKWMVDHLGLVNKYLGQAIAELQVPAGLTNIKLHRRCQAAESAVKENIEACRKQGVSLGRKLANAGYMILEDENKSQAKRIEELEKALKEIITESGEVDIKNWPTKQQICQAIAQQAIGEQ